MSFTLTKMNGMDLTFPGLMCPNGCGVEMIAAGANLGGRVDTIKRRCPECDQTLLIFPMRKDYEYKITATTADERREEYLKKRLAENDADRAKILEEVAKINF